MTYIKFHMQPDGFSDYCPVQVAYTDNIDPNGDGDLHDAVWKHTGVVPNKPGDNGVGLSANQGAQPVVDGQGGLDISYMTEECNTSIDHRILFKRSTDGGASVRRKAPDQQARPVAGQPQSRRPAAEQERQDRGLDLGAAGLQSGRRTR